MEDDVVDQSYLTEIQVGYDVKESSDPESLMFNQDTLEEEYALKMADQAYIDIKKNALYGDSLTEVSTCIHIFSQSVHVYKC